MDDLARLDTVGPYPSDHGGIVAGRDEANILTVGLGGDRKTKLSRKHSRFGLLHPAEREPQEIELLACGREKKITLIAAGIRRAKERPPLPARPALHIMPRNESRGAELARGLEQIGEFYSLIAQHTGYRSLAREITFCEIVDHRPAKAILIVEYIMGDAKPIRDAPRIANILPGAASAAVAADLAIIVELQRYAQRLIAGRCHKGGSER